MFVIIGYMPYLARAMLVAQYEVIDHDVEQRGNVDQEHQRQADQPDKHDIVYDEKQGYAQQGHHHCRSLQPGAEQLVMDVVLIRQEKVALVPCTRQYHTGNIKERYYQR